MNELSQDFSHESVIGIGHHRVCFIHPDDTRLCIKVVYNHSGNADKELYRELKYYERLNRTLKDWRGVPRYHGTVETNLGTGYVYDRIVDFDMQPSQRLDQRYSVEDMAEQAEEMSVLLENLKAYLADNQLVTMSLKPYNILCRRVSETELFPVICDNIGSATVIPLEMFSRRFYMLKLKRLWARFEKQPLLQAMYETLKQKNLSK